MIYVDTSAFLKLVKADEPEGEAFVEHVAAARDPRFVSSTLLVVESRRGLLRKSPGRLPQVDLMLADVTLIDMSRQIVERASRLSDPLLRSLDAIHLATALLIRDDVDELLTYDDRLAETARAQGIPTVAPA